MPGKRKDGDQPISKRLDGGQGTSARLDQPLWEALC
jgi:hypothetical protein